MADVLKFRNARGEMVEVESVPATRLKNEPASIIDQVSAGKAVAITRHNTPRAVIIAYEDFRQLALAREPSLGALTAEFDRMLEQMQSPGARKALAAAFESTPADLGRSAVQAVAKPPRATAAKRVSRRPRRGGA
ncbi:MAG TPA: type II toxin-antitoxin system prevent-host-death family antitoxin [Usitatibacter sp.]|nr:type II toxin-antitoxin system prevent-host-death family antitoxin [Usitatibacter sp.]